MNNPELSNGLPHTMADITPTWLSGKLSHCFPGIEITSVKPKTVINGTATKAIFQLDFKPIPGQQPPGSVCIKAGIDQAHAADMAEAGFYGIEGRFYRDLLPELNIPAARIYDVSFDDSMGDCVIVMEDLTASGARFLRVTSDTLTPDEAAMVLGDLARLHAFSWGNTGKYDWLSCGVTTENSFGSYLASFTPAVVADCLDRRAGALSAKNRNPERLIEALWRLESDSTTEPLCLLHGDCHIGNLFRLANGRVALCDWQTMFRGRWSHDVAYFMGTALDPAIRGKHERDLLTHYLDQLKSLNIEAPDAEHAWQEYRRAMVYGLYGWVTNPLYFQPEEISAAAAYRYSVAVEELGTFDLLMAN